MSHDTTDGPTFILKEKILALGTDCWVEDDHGHRQVKVDGKVMRIGNRMVLEDPSGAELFTIKHQLAHVHRTWLITGNDQDVAKMTQKLLGLHHHYRVEFDDGRTWKVDGNVVSLKFDIEDEDGREVAKARKKLVSVRNACGLQVHDPAGSAIVVAVALGLEMAEQADHS